MSRRALLALIGLGLVAAACGRKGPLEPLPEEGEAAEGENEEEGRDY